MNQLAMKIQNFCYVIFLMAVPSAGYALSIDDISDKTLSLIHI